MLFQELDEENAMTQTLQSVQLLQCVRGEFAAVNACRFGQVSNKR
jgi:hypothetical protein